MRIDDGPLLATAHGTDRPDTAERCGRSNTGFGLIYNWNRVGDGVHNLRAFADGVEFADVNFTVTTLGGEFLTGLQGDYTVPDFPAAGRSAKIHWSEPHQNFVFATPITIPPVANPPSRAGALLESPTQGSSESGIGLIRGWVCTASRVEVSIDGGPLMATAHGTDRPDTAGTCGDTANGFGLTYNWNRIGDGVHNMRAYADGTEFANVNFAVTTLGGEFLTGLLNKIRLLGFPKASTTTAARAEAATVPDTKLQWSEPDQNFVIASTNATGEKIALVSAITDILNRFAVLGVGASQTDSTGVHADKDATGAPTRINGIAWTEPAAGRWTDLLLDAEGLPATYRDSSGIEARLSQFTPTSVAISFFDSSGKPLGGPVTASLDGNLVQRLKDLIERLRAAEPNSAAILARPRAASVPALFSLRSILVELFAAGGYEKRPVIVGGNLDEGTLFHSSIFAPEIPDETDFRAALGRRFGAANVDAIAARYPIASYPSPNRAIAEISGESFFACAARRAARAMAANGAPTYLYQFEQSPEGPFLQGLGVFHSSEIPFVFGTDPAFPLGRVGARGAAVAEAIQGYWTRFAATGDPNGGAAPTWAPLDIAKDNYLAIGSAIAEKPAFRAASCDFWDAIVPP